MDIQNKATCQSIFIAHLEVLQILPSKAKILHQSVAFLVNGQAIFLSKSLELCRWGFNFLGIP